MTKWIKRLKWMRVSKYAIIICLLLSIVFAGFTVYGARTGDFTILLEGSDVDIAVYMLEDKSDLGPRLTAPTLDNMLDSTYEDFCVPAVRDKIVNGLGSKNDDRDRKYLCFSFVLCNLSPRAVDYDFSLLVLTTAAGDDGGQILNAMRILIFEEDDFEGGTIYAKPETDEASKKSLEENTTYTTKDFVSDKQICFETVYGFEPSAERKYTLLMWLEGWDNECADALFGAKIKMRLDINAR